MEIGITTFVETTPDVNTGKTISHAERIREVVEEIILADEPVASLDPARAEDILEMLTTLAKEEQQTVIASIHSVEYARKYFTRLIALKNGQILFDLPTDHVTDEQLHELYQLKELK